MIIWISGPTGSGKTSIAEMMTRINYCVIREDIPATIFENFVINPTRNCAMLQETIMLSRLAQWRNREKSNFIVFDRSINEDFFVFCQMHYEKKFLSNMELDRLRALSDRIQAELPAPDLILYMSAGLKTLNARICSSHPHLIIEGLLRQVELYESWLERRKEEVLRLDNSQCTLPTIAKLMREIQSC